jgi:hypothetical protein
MRTCHLFLSIALIVGSVYMYGCRKTCTSRSQNYRIGASIAFKNFDSSDLDTIIKMTYLPKDHFTHPVRIDTIFSPDVFKEGDYIFHSHSSRAFLGLNDDTDREVYVPAINKSYRLRAVYTIEENTIEESENGCRERPSYNAPDSLFINDVYYPKVYAPTTGFLYYITP